jgi:hypothetical protein
VLLLGYRSYSLSVTMPSIRELSLGTSLATRGGRTMRLQLGVVLGMYSPTGLEIVRKAEPRLISRA